MFHLYGLGAYNHTLGIVSIQNTTAKVNSYSQVQTIKFIIIHKSVGKGYPTDIQSLEAMEVDGR